MNKECMKQYQGFGRQMFSYKWVNNIVVRNFNENLCKDFKKYIFIFLSDVYIFYIYFIMIFRIIKNFIFLGCLK